VDDAPGCLHTCFEHPRDQTQERLVGNALCEDSKNLRMRQGVEKPGEIEIGNPIDGATHDLLIEATPGVVTASSWSESIGGIEEKRCVDRFQNPAGRLLDNFIFCTAHT
jgi:hypothetical protein